MVKKEYSQKEIIEIEGDDIIKEHMAKYNKLMTNMFNRFVRDLEQRYETVETIGKGGMKTRYILGAVRDVEAGRKDKRVDNGKGQVPLKYEQGFPIMMLQYLHMNRSEKPQTINKWLLDMSIITNEMFEASKLRYDSRVLENQMSKLEKKNVIKSGNSCMVTDYVEREIQRLNKYFMQVVDKLEEAKIIKHVPYLMGKCKIPHTYEFINNDKQELDNEIAYTYEYLELSPHVACKIAYMESSLQNEDRFKHLTLKEIHGLKGMKLVQEYWKEYKLRLNQITDESGERLFLVLVYTAHALFVGAGKNPIIKWLEKNNRGAIELYNGDSMKYFLENAKDFHETRNDYIVSLAENRQKKFNTPSEKVIGANEELGIEGRIVKVKNDPYDDKNIWDKTKEMMYLELYVQAYRKLQEYYGHTFK
ncbi:hypothetical protein MHB44_08020 [Lysinibacillus sp. FSL H8-0500]|uniref:hypothetical protein n=1 Tax=Lysinibacillus sp. FSL H8-0500 TaxID=2921393 RepID=UPI003100E616